MQIFIHFSFEAPNKKNNITIIITARIIKAQALICKPVTL